MPVIHFGWSNACCKGSLLKFILKDETSMEELQPRLLPPCHFPFFGRRVMQFGSPKSCRMEGVLPLQWRFFFFCEDFRHFLPAYDHMMSIWVCFEIEVVKTQFSVKDPPFPFGDLEVPQFLSNSRVLLVKMIRLYLAFLLNCLRFASLTPWNLSRGESLKHGEYPNQVVWNPW